MTVDEEPIAAVQARLVAALQHLMPDRDTAAVLVLLEMAAVRGRAWRPLDSFLRAHEDALTTARTVVPFGFRAAGAS